ncbi:MAG: methionine aminotransferase [Imperialibacter sp.]|uniref:methionine aminotransferase n=1 Tax=Imperialibacter sp. TaxID=2038411 RepID=UPI0032EAB066
MTPISSKLPDVGTSIFTVMSKLALDEGAVNLSQGFPDFPISEALAEEVMKAMRAGLNQYAPMPGYPPLLKAISEKVQHTFGWTPNPATEVMVTAGATESIVCAILTLIKEGDEVIVFEPAYDSYQPCIALAGGTMVPIPLNFPDYSIPWDQVEDSITPRTRMIVVNTPHNPSGAILAESDLEQLERLAHKHGIYILGDEAYEHIIFEGKKHHSLLSRPHLKPWAIAVFSFGKTFHVTGWKIGYMVTHPELMVEMKKVHQFLTFSVSTPMQAGIAAYLSSGDHYSEIGPMFQKKRDLFLDCIKGSDWKPLASHGTYFQVVSYDEITKENDYDLAIRLTKEMKVASIPVSVFYHNRTDHKVLRFCFAKQDETIIQGAEKLCRILK